MAYQGPGRYRHYKGGEYEVLGLGIVEHTLVKLDLSPGPTLQGEIHVVYRPLTPGSLLSFSDIGYWLRPLDDFNAMVDREHGQVPRFVYEGSIQATSVPATRTRNEEDAPNTQDQLTEVLQPTVAMPPVFPNRPARAQDDEED
jgi:hypothetical protein